MENNVKVLHAQISHVKPTSSYVQVKVIIGLRLMNEPTSVHFQYSIGNFNINKLNFVSFSMNRPKV